MTQQQVTTERPPLWRDVRVLRVAVQVIFLAVVVGVLWYLGTSLVNNMEAQGLRTDFDFLDNPAGYAISGSDFSSRDSVGAALLVGLRNTITVAIWGLILASVLGLVVGVARLSSNWLVRKVAAGFVEALRNVPLIIFLFFLYVAILQQLPRISDPIDTAGFVLSNRGLYTPWFEVAANSQVFGFVVLGALVLAIAVMVWRTRQFDATGTPHHRVLWGIGAFLIVAIPAWALLDRPVSISLPDRDGRSVTGGYEMMVEQGAVLVGLSLYMAAFIAEIVRGSVLAVPRGQSEAANALGLRGFQRYRYVVLPQALRIAVPPTGNEYINLAKNTALGVAIAFPELLRVTRISISQGNPAPQLIAIMAAMYLVISLVLSALVNIANRRLALKGA